MSWWLDLPREFTRLFGIKVTQTARAVLIKPGENHAFWVPTTCIHNMEKGIGGMYFDILTGFLEKEHPHLLPEPTQEQTADRLTVDIELITGINSIGYTISYRGRIITTHSIDVATQNITGVLGTLDEVQRKLKEDQKLCYSNNTSFQSIKKAFNARLTQPKGTTAP